MPEHPQKGPATLMVATVPTKPSLFNDDPEVMTLDGPSDLVEEYLRLVEERRAIDDRLSFVRAELELLAAQSLNDASPRGRFLGKGGAVNARLQPTCTFDRAAVARELQRVGRLADVAVLQGPALARYLVKEPALAAKLGEMVRMRRSVVLMAGGL